MKIYVESKDIPKNCGSCFCFHAENPMYCQAVKADTSKRISAPYGLPRPDWCPLIEVPPHYDLIDHNALKIAVMDCDAETRIDFLKHAMDCINKAPVVIPSDMPTYEAEEGE